VPEGTTGTRSARKKRRDWRPAFLAALEEQGTVWSACVQANVGRSTVYRERQRNEPFALKWADIESKVTDKLERKAVDLALDGDTQVLMFLLKARRPDVYRERVSVRHDGGLRVSVPEISESTDRLSAVVGLMGAIGVLPSPDATHGHPNGNGNGRH
jgi:hypothetical protein